MTDYIRLLLEEQEDGAREAGGEETLRSKGEGIALPLPDVVEEKPAFPGGRGEAGQAPKGREGAGEIARSDEAGRSPAEEEEAPPAGAAAVSEEEISPLEEAPDPLWQLWTARWLEADPEGKAGKPRTEVREEGAWTGSGGPEEETGEAARREMDWLELETGPIVLGPEEPGGGRSGGAAAEWADQALRASLAGLPAPPRETRVVTLQKPAGASGSGGLDPEGLDRLLRRDARRFDGGFQLL